MSQEELDPQENAQPTEATSTPMPEAPETSEAVEETEEEQNTEVKAVEAEDDHESPKERKLIIPDFDALTVEQSLEIIAQHIGKHEPQRIKGVVESGRSRILQELNAERDAAKAAFIEEGGNSIDFHYDQPLRKQLNTTYGGYRDKLRKHYSQLEAELSTNLATKLDIIEQIKGLPMMEGSAKDKYETFKGLRERWNNTGLVPKGDARNVWANYNHHVDNFFDYLRMAYDLIEIDYQNNLAEKVALCESLENMLAGGASAKIFKTLQQAHSKWKRIGPVPREHKDQLWDRFKAITSKVHELRDSFNEEIKAQNDEKIAAKKEVVAKIQALTSELPTKHGGWQKASKALEALRGEFKKIGFVKSEENSVVWEEYKTAQREFNRLKNAFYKEEKKAQRVNLEKKRALIELAESVKDSDDFAATAQVLKKAQQDWKKSGYVPKKEGDKLWEAFRSACNHFFDRMHGERKAIEKQSNAAQKAKEDFLAGMKKAKVASLDDAIALSEQWGALGQGGKREHDQNFDALLAEKVAPLGLSAHEVEAALMQAKVKAMVEADDQDGLFRQRAAIREGLDSAKKELHQLENNIAFFSASKGNPLLEAALAKIEEQKALVEHYTAMRKLFNSLLK